MNERIKEIAEQAGIEFVYDPTETPMRAFVECWEDELEKFAELIIKECIDIADQESKTQRSNYGKQAADQIWHTIQNRFGVA